MFKDGLLEEARMAHRVDFTVPERPLGNADVTFWVKRDSNLLGRLEISKGKIVWVPRNARTGYELGWQKFDELMQEHGKNK
jgi:hypothetical protein